MAADLETSSSGGVAGGAEVASSVRAQIEHYFSLANLKDDTFLVSQMNAQFYVPLRTVSEFARVKALTTSLDVIRDALRTSTAVAMDASETMVRPSVQEERNTIILREIPSSTPSEDVWGIFKVDSCPTPQTLRSDVGDIWFVEMNSEADAKTAMKLLRQGEFQGNRLRMRLKSGNALRAIVAGLSAGSQAAVASFAPASSPPRPGATPSPALSAATAPAHSPPATVLGAPSAPPASQPSSTSTPAAPPASASSPSSAKAASMAPAAVGTGGPSSAASGGQSVPTYAFGPAMLPGGAAMGMPMPMAGGAIAGSDAARIAAAMAMQGAPPGVAAAVASGDLVGPMAATAFTPAVPTHFPAVTYTADQILAIAQGLSTSGADVALPADAAVEEYNCIFSKRPNPELLHRQRTQSVEASLASGRPRFDSVASVDVTSMHFGDSERSHRKSSAAGARGIEVFGGYTDDSSGAGEEGGAPPSSADMASMLKGGLSSGGKAPGSEDPASGKTAGGKGRRKGAGSSAGSSAGGKQTARGARGGGGATAASATTAPGAAATATAATGKRKHQGRRGRAADGGNKEAAKPRAPAPYAAALLKAAPASVPKAINVRSQGSAKPPATTSEASSTGEEAATAQSAPAPAEAAAATSTEAAVEATSSADAASSEEASSKPRAWGAGSSIVAVLQKKPPLASGSGMAHISLK